MQSVAERRGGVRAVCVSVSEWEKELRLSGVNGRALASIQLWVCLSRAASSLHSLIFLLLWWLRNNEAQTSPLVWASNTPPILRFSLSLLLLLLHLPLRHRFPRAKQKRLEYVVNVLGGYFCRGLYWILADFWKDSKDVHMDTLWIIFSA